MFWRDRTLSIGRELFVFLWALFLFASPTLSQADTRAGELELIFYRAPTSLDWSSPGSLVRSTFFNRLKSYPHAISHVNVRLSCPGRPEFLGGMSAVKSSWSYARDVFLRGRSGDNLLVNVPGRLFEPREILANLSDFRSRGFVRGLVLELNATQCARASEYLDRYREWGIDRVYGGLRSDPLLGQGAGCAAFAISFLTVLDLIHPDFRRHWKRQLAVPLGFVATRTRAADRGFVSFLSGYDGRWADLAEPQIALDFWDPQNSYDWVGRVLAGSESFSERWTASADGLSMIWDVSRRMVPTTAVFPFGEASTRANLSRVLRNIDQTLEESEVNDPLDRECRELSICVETGPTEMFRRLESSKSKEKKSATR